MKIAIIDNGIYNDNIINCKDIKHYCLINNAVQEVPSFGLENNTHGTVCAYILSKIISDFELIDIQGFINNDAAVESLIPILTWCLEQSISIINMSFGTLNYVDFRKIEKLIQDLINKGTFIVAAHNNNNILSYPAVCKRVFSVRCDKGNFLKQGDFGYRLCECINIENSFVAHNEFTELLGTMKLGNGNSFSAPIITGHIARILQKNPKADYEKILEKLLEISTPELCIVNDLKKNFTDKKNQINVPVIAFYSTDKTIWYYLRKRFINAGYYETSFCESIYDENGIPFSLYAHKNETLSNNIVSTMGFIYDSDIFFLCLNRKRFQTKKLWRYIDFLITKEKNQYIVKNNAINYYCDDLNDIYNYILKFFAVLNT